jgi:hypothetical protein
MKVGIVFSVPIPTAPGVGWRWRSDDYQMESTEFFVFYADCIADAERNGYKVKPVPMRGPTASRTPGTQDSA